MKKILIVTTRFPFPLYSGDRLRIYNIFKNLSKKNKIDLIYTSSNHNLKEKIKFINKAIFVKTNIIKSIFFTMYFLLKGKPLQVGYFFSQKMKEEINRIHKNYDSIIFHLIRGSEFLPRDYKGKKILEMTDVISNNYVQTYNRLHFFNPLKYLYLIEHLFLKKYEKKIQHFFDHVVLVSQKDVQSFLVKKKIKVIPNGTNNSKKIFKFNKKNNDVVFIGNINYLPNKIACYEFIKIIMPKLKERGLHINFKIIGKTSLFLKFLLSRFENVEVFSQVKSTEKFCKGAFCGICNINIAAGVQNKILEYMRIGLPTITSERCFNAAHFKKNKDILVYKNQKELINHIIKLKTNKNLSNKISSGCYKKIKNKFTWEKSLREYSKLI